MLPIPFVNYIPKFFKRDDKLLALSNKADVHLEQWKEDILSIENFKNPFKIEAMLLGELGTLLNADIRNQDSEVIKRKKIAGAVRRHKNRGTWEFDTKLRIDAIVGGDAKIGQSVGGDDFILIGDETVPSSYVWAVLGGKDVNQDFGIRLTGEGGENTNRGVILIDVDDSTLTADQVEQVKLDIIDSVPVYFSIKLGYTSDGTFFPYANGQIG